jgi:hypothetical protein
LAEYGTTFPVTIPSLSEDANIVTAFEDYHDDIQTYLGAISGSIDTKQNIITGAASSVTTTNLTFSRAVVSNSSGKIAASIVTSAELEYLSGATGKTGTGNLVLSASPTFSGAVVLPATTSVGTVTGTEISYLSGLTSSVQTQLNGKVDEINGAVTTADTSLNVVRNIRLSTDEPTGGSDGDVWLQYEV